MRARVPNFVKSQKMKISEKNTNSYISNKDLNKLMKEQQRIMPSRSEAPLSNYHQIRGKINQYQHSFPVHDHQYGLWHSKSHESGISKKNYDPSKNLLIFL